MYVDFNGKRVDLGKKVVAALVTLAIVGGAVGVWQFWPRERAVYVNRPTQAPVQSEYERAKRNCAAGFRYDEEAYIGSCVPIGQPEQSNCPPGFKQTSLGCLRPMQ